SVLEPELDADRLGAFLADILGNRAGAFEPVAFLAPENVAEAGLALALSPGVHPVAEGAGAAGPGGNGPDLGLLVVGEDVGEYLEAGAAEMLRHFLHDDRVAQIRLVRAVFAHGFVVRDAREGLRYRFAVGKSLEDAAHNRLHGGEHVLLFHEAHFEVELVELAWQAVGARVLVAETGRDLEIAIESRHHDELFVDLRSLRQRVELAGMDARRHEEVAGAFRRRCRQDRGGKFGKASLPHPLAHFGDDLRARDDIPVQRLTAQVEEAVFETNVLRIVRLAEDRQWKLFCLRQDLHLPRKDLHLAGRQIRVYGLCRACLYLAVDADHPFAANFLGSGEAGR